MECEAPEVRQVWEDSNDISEESQKVRLEIRAQTSVSGIRNQPVRGKNSSKTANP